MSAVRETEKEEEEGEEETEYLKLYTVCKGNAVSVHQ
jgi:hypothetical protein